jgi:putative transcriptional regulator
MEFEWDPAKEEINKQKHGLSFLDAIAVFDDPFHIEEESVRPELGERRLKAIGRVGAVILTVIFTDRATIAGSFQHEGQSEMNDEHTIRVRRLPDGTAVQVLADGSTQPIVSTTDWDRVNAMTEDEIDANAAMDPDNPPLTPEELARMRLAPNPKRIRQRLRMTQEQFAAGFQVPLGTLRDWEQGTRIPDSAARTLLRVIDRNPELVLATLAADPATLADSERAAVD